MKYGMSADEYRRTWFIGLPLRWTSFMVSMKLKDFSNYEEYMATQYAIDVRKKVERKIINDINSNY